MKRRYKIFKHLTLTIEGVVNALFILAFAIALLAPYISPKITVLPAFFNLSYPVWFFLLLLFFLFYLLRRRWLLFGIYSVLLLFAIPYSLAYCPVRFGTNKAPQDAEVIKVMTYNVKSFKGKSKNGETAIKFINNSDADIVCLQEAIFNSNLEKNTALLKKSFGKEYPYIHEHVDYESHSQGLVLLSKYPIIKQIPIRYPADGNSSCSYMLKHRDGEKIMVVNNHMESYRLTQRDKQTIKGWIKKEPLLNIPRIYSGLREKLGPKLETRAFAAGVVKQTVDSLSLLYAPAYSFVCGDMNDTPMSYTYKTMRSDMRDAYKDAGSGFGFTYNERFFWFRIDHIFYSGNLKAYLSKVENKEGISDHNPLVAEFYVIPID